MKYTDNLRCDVCGDYYPSCNVHECEPDKNSPRSERIQPDCPACGGSLFVASGGWLTCSSLSCPEPDYATAILRAERIRIIALRGLTRSVDHHRHIAPLGREPGEEQS